MSAGRDRGALAIVLHTHMPYVEGFGTWPSGEEWLWEAIASCYVPLLELLDAGAPLTLSLTPVLCDQLEAPGVHERFAAFVHDVRGTTHAQDAAGLRAGGHHELANEIERSWGDYVGALERLDERGGNLLESLAPYAQWASAATHAVLPLLATEAGVRLQLRSGIAAHRRRFGAGTPKGTRWRGGLWLPECGYAPWLERALEDAGVSAVCVELTGHFGLGAAEHLRPIATDAGVLLVPVDRATMSLMWSDDGYPADGAYRDYHHHTVHHHNPWSNDGGLYDHERALALAREHAADFVARTIARLRQADVAPGTGGGLVVCALDTELLGHWWYEGLEWLVAVVQECARQGLELVRLDDALERIEPVSAGEARLPQTVSSWGASGDLSTWSGPAVADMAFAARAGELQVVAAGERASVAAVRELLALQASDWPFMVTRELAGPYPRERFDAHRRALGRALDAALANGSTNGAGEGDLARLRNLAVDADPRWLLVP
ncbi:MAG TPA: 1,4-alpha-glucan branching protein domain-containing protein [Solirubrobacteraceae bacterium]|nr:1,4-alpha-glucan branching protein domain-containing protein [Solirubrobacteraceae bacterium]